jgi:MoxR-like ATPase
MIKAFTKALGLTFKRIQFTPDLLPSDLIGTVIYNAKTGDFETKKGPIFAQLILADEINRAPAKVQAALLEAMQEHQVTIGSHTFILDEPFIVFATQNPVEQEGTYSLPEAQIDRFMFKILIDYPTIQEEIELLKRHPDISAIRTLLTKEDLFKAREEVNKIYLDDKICDYIARIIDATRHPEKYGMSDLTKYREYGASPRATLALYQASKAHAFLKQRNFVIPDDIKAVSHAILRHRIIISYEAEIAGYSADSLIDKILSGVPTP